MAASVNKVFLLGNVGRDPEIRFLPNGDAVASFSLATSEKWTTKNGDKQERTDWHRCEVFGKLADVVKNYVTKGKQLMVVGTVRYEEWTDKGQKRNTTKIRVLELTLLGGGERRREDQAEDFQDASDDIPF